MCYLSRFLGFGVYFLIDSIYDEQGGVWLPMKSQKSPSGGPNNNKLLINCCCTIRL